MDQQEDSVPELDEPEHGYIVCLSVKDDTEPIPGSTITNCVLCDRRVWIAPTSDSVLIQERNVEPICFKCAYEQRDQIKEIQQPTEEQQAEILKELKRRNLI